MNRETRANLIFLVLFLAVALPGVVMLVRKKLDPTRRPMWLPDNVKRQMVFIDPVEAPDFIPRITPALTAAWVGDEARQRLQTRILPSITLPDGRSAPLMSEQRLAQVIHAERSGDDIALGLLIWNLPRDASDVVIELRAADVDAPFAVENLVVNPGEVPKNVKRDLEDTGYPRPPLKVQWVSARLQGAARFTPLRIAIDCTADGRVITDTVTLAVK